MSRKNFLAVAALVLSLPLAFVARAQDASGGDQVTELVSKLRSDTDRAPVEVIRELGALRTRAALDGLLQAYDGMQTTFMKREIVRVLPGFDGVGDAEQAALQKLMDVATSSEAIELRTAALEGLGTCVNKGKDFLRLIVVSQAQDAVREQAAKLHVKLASKEDYAWYREIYKPKELDKAEKDRLEKEAKEKAKAKAKAKKAGEEEEPEKPKRKIALDPIRESFFAAIASDLTVEELITATKDRYRPIRVSAVEELTLRNPKELSTVAHDLFKQLDQAPAVRLAAARALVKLEGTKFAPEMIKRATSVDAPVELQRGLAAMLVAFDDPMINRTLIQDLGKGQVKEQLFQMYVVRSIKDERVDKALIKMLLDKEPQIVRSAVLILGERKTKDALEGLSKIWKKSKDPILQRAALDATSQIRQGDPTWVDELVALTSDPDPEVRYIALEALSGVADKGVFDKLVAALEDPSWSVRLASLYALERLRMTEAITAIAARMPKEEGRMAAEFSNVLWRLTGQSFGEHTEGWTNWWNTNKANFQILSDADLQKVVSGAEEWRLRQTTRVNSEFFGIRIVSRKVIFIVDVSGSMVEPMANDYKGKTGWNRMAVAREELKSCLSRLDSAAFFNILTFSSGVERWLDGGLAACDETNRANAITFVEKLKEFGGTNLHDALREAFDDPDVDTIFLMSDGEPSAGEVIEPGLIREQVARWNEHRKIVINTIAVGGQFNILEWLAEDSGGTHVKFE